MEDFLQGVGTVVVASCVIYIILFFLNLMLKAKAEPFVKSEAMPILRPLPIPTKK